MENVKHKPCLILNQDWTPLTVVNWKRAICLGIIGEEMISEGVRIIEWYSDDFVKSSGGDFVKVPAVAVLSPPKSNTATAALVVADEVL